MEEIDNSKEIEHEVKLVIKAVLEAEQRKLHMDKPRDIINDIEKIIKNIIKEQ
ncbi:hypothetical protein ISS37_06915 [candidate division KSB1 bacterium]|nr:hypothetical protein [candidate division KSB1 bacterium]